jgi:hypothetical protein
MLFARTSEKIGGEKSKLVKKWLLPAMAALGLQGAGGAVATAADPGPKLKIPNGQLC